MTLRYPEVRSPPSYARVLTSCTIPKGPTSSEKEALNSYFHLLSRLYPCGECAAEFQMLLKRFPPQTSSRRSAALWYPAFFGFQFENSPRTHRLCTVHNEVNKRLKKVSLLPAVPRHVILMVV